MFKIIVGLLGVLGVMMALSLGGLYWNGYLARTQEGIRTDIMEESVSYTRGMRRELGRLRLEWEQADAAGRVGIEAYVRDTFSGYLGVEELPENLQQFLIQVGAY
jgi:hypothetical protein